ncbi:MAG: polyhydroxyalkanoate depolymerase [Alphaproteobacteria bacterium]|nr:polyhydroxyalkanoate depolymerase [Alphaproteobacteria bacterium]
MALLEERRRLGNHALGYRRSGDLFEHSEMTSIYYTHDMRDFLSRPVNFGSFLFRKINSGAFSPYGYTTAGRSVAAGVELLERSTNRYRKPSFGIEGVTCSDDHAYAIHERVLDKKAFCQLLHFKKELIAKSELTPYWEPTKQPKVLIVAPYSGHYATLLRDTVRALLPDNDVYITDWENARDVPLVAGHFNLEDYIQYLMDFSKIIGHDYHMVAVCQPAVPVLAMTALLAAHDSPYQPRSITLMGGPIDTRINPTKVNTLSKEKPNEWFKRAVIARVPHYYPGALRSVCPGFLMLQGFMSLNLDAHLGSHHRLFEHLIKGDADSADSHRSFYDEYRAVLDLPSHYFLDSVRAAFQEHLLPRGEMFWKGERVNTHAIRNTALMTVEGEKDDISGVGQTRASHDICPNIPSHKRQHHLQPGVGHYGVFNGKRWRQSTAPLVSEFIYNNDPISDFGKKPRARRQVQTAAAKVFVPTTTPIPVTDDEAPPKVTQKKEAPASRISSSKGSQKTGSTRSQDKDTKRKTSSKETRTPTKAATPIAPTASPVEPAPHETASLPKQNTPSSLTPKRTQPSALSSRTAAPTSQSQIGASQEMLSKKKVAERAKNLTKKLSHLRESVLSATASKIKRRKKDAS